MTAGKRLRSWRDYLLVLVLVLVSGSPDVFGRRPVLLVLSIVLLFLLAREGKLAVTFRCQVASLIFIAILSVQSISMRSLHLVSIAGFLTRLFIVYGVIRVVGDVPRKYVGVMFFLSLVSWPLYSINLVSGGALARWLQPVGEMVGVEDVTNVVVHSFTPNIYRNASLFWEPGAFSAYLLLAIMFLGLERERYKGRLYMMLVLALSATVVSTLSSSGLVLLPLCLLTALYRAVLASGKKPLAAIAFTAGLLFCYGGLYNLSIVGQKIRGQYEDAAYRRGKWEINRFGTLLSDLEYIRLRPLFGWGLHSETRYFLHGGYTVEGQGNGLSDFAAKFGLLGLATYIGCTWRGVYRISNQNKIKTLIFMMFLVLVLSGEALLNHPVYLGLMFLAPEQGNGPS